MVRLFAICVLAIVPGYIGQITESPELISARLYVQQKDLKRAEEFFLKALELAAERNNAEVPFRLARDVYAEQRRYTEMNRMLDEAIRRNLTQKIGQYSIKELVLNLRHVEWTKEYQRGADLYNAVLSQTGGSEPNKTQREQLLRAIDFFETAILIWPNEGSAYSNIVYCYRHLGDAEGERTALSVAVELDPENGNILVLAGEQAREEGDHLRAVEFYRKAHDALPENVDIMQRLTAAYTELGQPEEALAILRKALRHTSKEPAVYYNFGVVYASIGNGALENGQGLYREAVSSEPVDVNKLETAVENLDQAQKAYFESLYFMEKAIGSNPDDTGSAQAIIELLKTQKILSTLEKSAKAILGSKAPYELAKQPETDLGKKITLKGEITRADLTVLLTEEIKIAEIFERFSQSSDFSRKGTVKSRDRIAIPEDVKGHWAEQWIKEALRFGIFELDTKGKFYPARSVTRMDYALVVQRILVKATGDFSIENRYMGESPSRLSDVPSSHFAYNAMALCSERGIIKADMYTGQFNPNGHLSGTDAVNIAYEISNSLHNSYLYAIAKRTISSGQQVSTDDVLDKPSAKRLQKVDDIPPTITIFEPLLVRGMKKALFIDKTTLVKGRATDESGIFEVVVNGLDAQLDAQGNFWAEVRLKVGENRIYVKATDIHGNEGGTSFTVIREAGAILVPEVVRQESEFQFGEYHALLIAVKDYIDNTLDLRNPIRDARNLKRILLEHYTFGEENIHIMENPTRREIHQKFSELRKTLGPGDNLLVFYAGHGYWDVELKQGYWLPRDARRDDDTDWISNSTVRDMIRGIKTQHTMLITDACFSGGIFQEREVYRELDIPIQKLYKIPSRKALTSGNLKAVPDESVFIEFLIKRLKENKERYLYARKLHLSMWEAVTNNSPSNQTPLYGVIIGAGDEGQGDFIFVRKR